LSPSGVAAAATWNRELIEKMGVSLGQDSRARGVHILLGPGVNIYRSPMCGRNFEYFGEDPYLAGQIAANYIRGLQSQGVMACVKHFAGNNQEWDRHSVSSDIDERTLHEIYFPAFEAAVKEADVASVMTSYNLLNGVHASESKYLNYDILRDKWGFEGLVMSDWTSCYSPLNVATWGVDLEMPLPKCMKPEILKQLVENGTLDVRYLDMKCQHIIQTILAYEFDKRDQLDASIPENNPYSDKVSHEISREAIVMLKNDGGFLPKKKGKFVVCGPNADRIVTGGGSGFVTPIVNTSVAAGLASMGKSVKCTVLPTDIRDNLDGICTSADMTQKGVKVEVFANTDLAGTPVETYVAEKVFLNQAAAQAHEDVVMENVSSRYTFYYTPSHNESLKIYASGNDGIRLYLNGKLMVDRWNGFSWNKENFLYDFSAGQVYEFVVEHFNRSGSIGLELQFENMQITNTEAIKAADCVVVCLGHDSQTEKENFDRTFSLPQGQEDYLRKVLALNKNVVVVLNAGGGIDMNSWLPDVKAVLMAWYPGQQGGLAISEIITGRISPSGRLPISIEKSFSDNPVSESYYENVDRIRTKNINPYSRVEYREGLFLGYRGYQKSGIEPLFPFGFGLTYTDFEYSGLQVNKTDEGATLSFVLKNVGKYPASEVAQVYVGDVESSLIRPEMELKGFEKVYLEPGKSKSVTIELGENALRFYDPVKHQWVVEPGTFKVYVGSSSADIRLTGEFVR
jgi:beta-glucosidase